MFLRKRWNPQPARDAMQQAGQTIMRRAADYMEARAKMLAPVDTGVLVNSIQVVAASGSTAIHVIAAAPYAQWVEFGHMAGGVTWVAPNPFMRNALADTAKAFPTIAQGVRIDRPGGANDVGNLGATFQIPT